MKELVFSDRNFRPFEELERQRMVLIFKQSLTPVTAIYEFLKGTKGQLNSS